MALMASNVPARSNALDRRLEIILLFDMPVMGVWLKLLVMFSVQKVPRAETDAPGYSATSCFYQPQATCH